MTQTSPYSAVDSLTGVTWQYKKGLERLLEVSKDEIIRFEGIDDVVIYRDEGVLTTAIQTKHHKGDSNLAIGSRDLWKTLRVWADLSEKEVQDLDAMELITTENVTDVNLLKLTEQPRTETTNQQIFDRILARASQSSSDTKVKSCMDTWKNCPQSRTIITKMLLRVEEPKNNELSARINRLINQHYFHDDIEALCNELIIWFIGEAQVRVSEGDGTISAREVKQKITLLLQQRIDETPMPLYGDESISYPPDEAVPLFIKQILKIGLRHERQPAWTSYIRANLERRRISRYIKGKIWLQVFNAELVNKYDRHKRRPNEQLADAEAKGREVYWKCMEESATMGTRQAASHEIEGSYHWLVDQEKIWWHPLEEAKID